MDVVQELLASSCRGTRGFSAYSQTSCQNGINGPEKGLYFGVRPYVLGLLVMVGKGVRFAVVSQCKLPPGTAPSSELYWTTHWQVTLVCPALASSFQQAVVLLIFWSSPNPFWMCFLPLCPRNRNLWCRCIVQPLWTLWVCCSSLVRSYCSRIVQMHIFCRSSKHNHSSL